MTVCVCVMSNAKSFCLARGSVGRRRLITQIYISIRYSPFYKDPKLVCVTNNDTWITNMVSHKSISKEAWNKQRAMERKLLNVKLQVWQNPKHHHSAKNQSNRYTEYGINTKWEWTHLLNEWQQMEARHVKVNPPDSWQLVGRHG